MSVCAAAPGNAARKNVVTNKGSGCVGLRLVSQLTALCTGTLQDLEPLSPNGGDRVC